MAYPDTELVEFRKRLTSFLDGLTQIDHVLAPVEGAGADDTERQAFFDTWIAANPDYDITSVELIDIVTTLRSVRTSIDNNLPTLAKGRI